MLLAPTALLIVLMLGAVTLEVAAMHLRQRQLDDLATTIANDAATVGFDTDAYRSTGTISISQARAIQVVGPSISGSDIPEARAQGFDIAPGPAPSVEVDLALTHEFVLGQLLWGTSIELTATGQAALLRPEDT